MKKHLPHRPLNLPPTLPGFLNQVLGGSVFLVILFIILMVILLQSAVYGNEEVSGEPVAGSNVPGQSVSTIQTGCPSNSIQVIKTNQSILARISANIPIYKAAATANNMPWEMLAALHYRESNVAPSGPVRSGEGYNEGPFQLHDYAVSISNNGGNPITISYEHHSRQVSQSDIQDLATSADLAGNFIQAKTGYTLTSSSSDADVKQAFYAYNGFIRGQTADQSAYVMNNFDANHQHMSSDARDGTFTVYYLLHYLAIYNGSGQITGFKDCAQPANTTGSPTSNGSNIGQTIVQVAQGFLGDTTVPDPATGENEFQCSAKTKSCASFVSTVLINAGVTSNFLPTATQIWNQDGGTVIISRGESLNQSLLQPGDVVWFGLGQTGGSGAQFNHIAIYIGNGQIIGTSSSQTKVVQESITVFTGVNAFSGARRYGSQ